MLTFTIGYLLFFVYQEYLYIENLNKIDVYIYKKRKTIDDVLHRLFDFSFSENILLSKESKEYNDHKTRYKKLLRL